MRKHTTDCFLTSPQLLCLEKTKSALRLSHFGKISMHNSVNPELTIKILRHFRTLQTEKSLHQVLKNYRKPDIANELKRLQENALVARWTTLNRSAKVKFRSRPASSDSSLGLFTCGSNESECLREAAAKCRVTIVDLIGSAEPMTNKLKEFGIKTIRSITKIESLNDIKNTDFVLVFGEARHKLEFSKINQLFLKKKIKWLLVTADAFGGILGPTFGIAGGPCFDCMIDHSKRNFDQSFQTQEFNDLLSNEAFTDRFLQHYPLAQNLIGFAAVETLKIISQVTRPHSFDGFHTFDFFNYRMNYSNVSASPTCPICSGYARLLK